MPQIENDIAGLRTVEYLLSQALRIADERQQFVIAAKITDCIEQTQLNLAIAVDLQKRGP